jgi:hypothetical protein
MGFLDGLIGALGDLGSEIAAILVYLLQLIIEIFQFIWDVLVQVFNFFWGIIQDVGKFFQYLWDDFFKGIFTGLFNALQKFGQWLHNIFGPVVDFLRKVSTFIDRIYRIYIRPILQWIRLARIFLQLLKALGVKWAAKLDTILGQVQADIQRAFLTIKGYLNVMIDLLNILSDPSNLLRRPTTLLSLVRVSHAAIRMFTGLPPGFFIPSAGGGQPLGLGFLPTGFNAGNPLQNPPASYYLAFDGGVPDFSGLAPGDTIADGSIDSISPFNYFTDNYTSLGTCADPVTCLTLAANAVLNNK